MTGLVFAFGVKTKIPMKSCDQSADQIEYCLE